MDNSRIIRNASRLQPASRDRGRPERMPRDTTAANMRSRHSTASGSVNGEASSNEKRTPDPTKGSGVLARGDGGHCDVKRGRGRPKCAISAFFSRLFGRGIECIEPIGTGTPPHSTPLPHRRACGSAPDASDYPGIHRGAAVVIDCLTTRPGRHW